MFWIKVPKTQPVPSPFGLTPNRHHRTACDAVSVKTVNRTPIIPDLEGVYGWSRLDSANRGFLGTMFHLEGQEPALVEWEEMFPQEEIRHVVFLWLENGRPDLSGLLSVLSERDRPTADLLRRIRWEDHGEAYAAKIREKFNQLATEADLASSQPQTTPKHGLQRQLPSQAYSG